MHERVGGGGGKLPHPTQPAFQTSTRRQGPRLSRGGSASLRPPHSGYTCSGARASGRERGEARRSRRRCARAVRPPSQATTPPRPATFRGRAATGPSRPSERDGGRRGAAARRLGVAEAARSSFYVKDRAVKM
eukprot:scaffold314033_cov33-Tisochrysis_lutea.AAC.1